MSGGKGGKVTVGYEYHLGWHMVLCHGHIDTLSAIYVDGREAWSGAETGGAFTVSAPELFGGEAREGGVSGTIDLETGLPDQLPNAYLQGQLGDDIPAFRGVTAVVGNQVYMGNNPYLKPWSFQMQRIHLAMDGQAQWYDEKAAIGSSNPSTCNYMEEYFSPTFTNTISEEGELDFPFPQNGFAGSQSSFGGYFKRADISDDLDQPYGCALGAYSEVLQLFWNSGDIEAWIDDGSYRASVQSIVGSIKKDSARLYGQLCDVGRAFNVTVASSSNDVEARIVLSITDTHVGAGVYECTLKADITGTGGVDNSTTTVAIGYVENEWLDVVAKADIGPATVVEVSPGTFHVVCECAVEFCLSGYESLIVNHDVVIASGSSAAVNSEIDANSVSKYFRNCNFLLAGFTKNAGFGCEDQEAFFELGGCNDMNPAHIIRECLTDPDWGMGYNDSDIDDASFTAAADALYDEGMGISLQWLQEIPIEDFVAEIQRHIDGVLYVSRVTGKFILKLVRDDASLSDLLVLDEDINVVAVKNARRPAIAELTSSVTVNFHDQETNETASVTQHNQALVQIQGSVTHTTIHYPGFSHYDIAARACQRDMRQLSVPLLACEVYGHRDAEDLYPGDAFILNAPTQGILNTVMRVQQMQFGSGEGGPVKIEALEDVFALPGVDEISGSPDVGIWIDPLDQGVLQAEPRLATELPYYELVAEAGQSAADTILGDDPDAGFLLVAGGRQGAEINASGYTDSGAGYSKTFSLDFAPYAYLAQSVGYTDETIYIDGGKDLDLVEAGTLAQIGDELVRVDSIAEDSNGQYIAVGRGVLDTVPAEHEVSSNLPSVLFLGFSYSSDDTQYTASDSVDVKLRTVLGASTLSLAAAPADTVDFDSRAIRPYPPGDLQIDGLSYPDPDSSNAAYYSGANSLTWSHRDRSQQTDGSFYDYSAGDIGPEAGVTYLVEGYSTLEGGSLSGIWLSQNVGDDNFWEQDSNTDSDIGVPPENSTHVHFRVTSLRDGYRSWQSPEVTLVYELDSEAGGGDPYFANVVSLIHFENNVTDVIGLATWSINGSTGYSTSPALYGTYSLDCTNVAAGCSSDTTPAAWDIGTQDYAVEIAGQGTDKTGIRHLWDFGYGNNLPALLCLSGSGLPRVYYSSSNILTGTTDIFDGSTHVIAVARKGGFLRLIVDGVVEDSVADTNTYDNMGANITIGKYLLNANNGARCYLDEWRFTVGEGRYDGNYTPSLPFSDA